MKTDKHLTLRLKPADLATLRRGLRELANHAYHGTAGGPFGTAEMRVIDLAAQVLTAIDRPPSHRTLAALQYATDFAERYDKTHK